MEHSHLHFVQQYIFWDEWMDKQGHLWQLFGGGRTYKFNFDISMVEQKYKFDFDNGGRTYYGNLTFYEKTHGRKKWHVEVGAPPKNEVQS